MCIVICEDDPIHTMALEMVLEAEGHRVVAIFSRADEAILHCWKDAPDLAVVDLNLADGPTGLSLVRSLDRLGIATVIVSGDAHRLGGEGPARALVTKPYRDHQLLDAVAACQAA